MALHTHFLPLQQCSRVNALFLASHASHISGGTYNLKPTLNDRFFLKTSHGVDIKEFDFKQSGDTSQHERLIL